MFGSPVFLAFFGELPGQFRRFFNFQFFEFFGVVVALPFLKIFIVAYLLFDFLKQLLRFLVAWCIRKNIREVRQCFVNFLIGHGDALTGFYRAAAFFF